MIRAPLQAKRGTLLSPEATRTLSVYQCPRMILADLLSPILCFPRPGSSQVFFSSESGKSLSDGNRIVPLGVGKPSSSFSNFSITPDPVGKRLQWFLNAAYPSSISLYLNIGIP